MLWKILLALIAGWLILVFWWVAVLFLTRQAMTEQRLYKLFVLMSNQDDAAEGFLRKLISWRNKLWPRLKVAVVDCGSSDETGKIIRLLAKELDYPVIDGEPFRQKQNQVFGKGEVFIRYYDVRWQKGKNLIQTPLFSLLKFFLRKRLFT